jgi:GDP-L-fucose synthase
MKVLVTGGSGLVGKGIESFIKKNHLHQEHEFIFCSSRDCDLSSLDETRKLFEKHQPDFVIHLAAKVGGLFKNMNFKVDMLEQNMLINFNVLRCCHDFNVKKCVSCLSTCIFPDKTTYPINEEMLHNGPPHNSNDAYAYAKRMIEIHSKAYNEQYPNGCVFQCVIPTNIYGPHDNYNLEDAHVIPALIHRCKLCKDEGKDFIVKGSGKPLRQFIYSEDLGELIVWTLFNYEGKDSLILSVEEKEEVTIDHVALAIARCYNYEHKLVYDTNFSDGQYKKTADNSKLMSLHGEFNFTSIDEGIEKSVNWFINNFQSARK